jgi:hypothetical protein
MFDSAVEATQGVEKRTAETLGERVFNFALLIGLLPNGTRRIITEIPAQTLQDTVAVMHASRVFGDAMGAYLLLRKGLITQATSWRGARWRQSLSPWLFCVTMIWLANGAKVSAFRRRRSENDLPGSLTSAQCMMHFQKLRTQRLCGVIPCRCGNEDSRSPAAAIISRSVQPHSYQFSLTCF